VLEALGEGSRTPREMVGDIYHGYPDDVLELAARSVLAHLLKLEAEGRARSVELEGEAEGKKILAVGTATAEAYEKQVAAVGQMNLAGIEVTKAIAGAGLKITPDIMVGGGGDGGGGGGNVFSAFIAQLLAGNRVAIQPPNGGSSPAGGSGGGQRS